MNATLMLLTSVISLTWTEIGTMGGGMSSGGHGTKAKQETLPSYHLGLDNGIFWKLPKMHNPFDSDAWSFPAKHIEGVSFESFLSERESFNRDFYEFQRKNSILVIDDYKKFLMNHTIDGNIYSDYLNFRDQKIDGESLKNLLDHWQTDLITPSLYPHYQSNNGVDWDEVDNHINEALREFESTIQIESWIDRIDTDDQTNSIFKFEDRIYINPYKDDIERVRFENDTWLTMEDVRKDLSYPSMVDFDKNKVKSITFDNGEESNLDNLKSIQELSVKPYSKRP